MRDAIVFNGASNLDFQDVRTNVTRIPEVVLRIREAQKIWDTLAVTPLDLANFIASEDAVFLGHIKLKSFATAVVQVGLLDRFLKSHKLPEYVIGAINGDSPLQVAIGKISFLDMVAESAALTGVAGRPTPQASGSFELPVLAGMQLVEYAIFRKNAAGDFQRVNNNFQDIEKMIIDLVDQHEVNRLVLVGPGNSVIKKIIDLNARDVQVLESIDLDPMLSWFWARVKENRLAVAN